MMALRTFFRRFFRQDKGVSAVEFALISPVLILGFLGSVELCNTLVADRKITNVASSVADLIAQEVEITDGELADIFAAAEALLAPLPADSLAITVESVVDEGDRIRVRWTETYNGGAGTGGTNVPEGILTEDASVIRVRTSYTYETQTGYFIAETFTFTDQFYARPRRSVEVTRN